MSFVSRHVTDSHDFCKPTKNDGETKEQNEALPYDKETSVNMYQKSQSNWSKYGDLNGDGKKDIHDLYLTRSSLLSNSAIDRALYFDESLVKGDGNCFYHAMVNYIVGTGDFKDIFMQDYCNQYTENIADIKNAYGGNKKEYRKMYMMHWLRKKLLEYHQTNSLGLQEKTKEEQEKYLKAGVDKTCLDKETNTDEGKVGLDEWSEDWEIDLMARYLDIEICTFYKLSADWAYSTSRPEANDLEGDVCFLYNSGDHFTNLTFKDQPDGVFWSNERERIMKKLSDKNELKKSQKKTIGDMSNEDFNSYIKKRIENNCWNNYRYTRDIIQQMSQRGMAENEQKKRVIFHIMTDIEGPKVNDDQDVSECKSMSPDDQKLHYDVLLMKNKRNDRINRFKEYINWAKVFLAKWDNANIRYNFEFKFQQMLGQNDLLTTLSVKEFNDKLKKFFSKEIERIDEEGMGRMTKRKFQKDLTFKTHAKIIKENGDTYQTDKIWKNSEKKTNKATNEIRESPEYNKRKFQNDLTLKTHAKIIKEKIAQLRSVDNVLEDIKDKTEQDIYFKQMAVFLLRHYQLLLKPKKALPGVFLSSYPNFEWKFENKDKKIACGWRWEALMKKGYRTDEHMEPIRKTHSLINELNVLGEEEEGLNLFLGSTLEQLTKLEKIIKNAKKKLSKKIKAGKAKTTNTKNNPELSWDDPWSDNFASSLVPKTPAHDEAHEQDIAPSLDVADPTKTKQPTKVTGETKENSKTKQMKKMPNKYGYNGEADKKKNTWKSLFNDWKTLKRTNGVFVASLRKPGDYNIYKGVRKEYYTYLAAPYYFAHLMKWADLFGWKGIYYNDIPFERRVKKTEKYFSEKFLTDTKNEEKKENDYNRILEEYNNQPLTDFSEIKIPPIGDNLLKNIFTAIMLIDNVWREWLRNSYVGKRYLDASRKKDKIQTALSYGEVEMDKGISEDDPFEKWFGYAKKVFERTDPSQYTSVCVFEQFEKMEEVKETGYQNLNEKQWLSLFVENIRNVRYFTMMQLLSTDKFTDFLNETGGDKPYPYYNFGYNCFNFLSLWPGMGKTIWEDSKTANESNESNESKICGMAPSAPTAPDADNIYKRKNTLDIDDY